jgi:hypothetical protein
MKYAISSRVSRSFLFIVCILFTSRAMAATDWSLKRDEDGIKVYTASVAGSNVKAIKVECTTRGTPAQLAHILLDVATQKDWVYSTKSASVVKRISENELIYYTEKSMPWPITNRDAVMDIKVHQEPALMTVNVASVNNAVPVKSDIVRVPSSTVSWKVTPLSSNTMKIEYEAQADPGGSVPAWVTNMFLSKGPFETFKKLKAKLGDSGLAQGSSPVSR